MKVLKGLFDGCKPFIAEHPDGAKLHHAELFQRKLNRALIRMALDLSVKLRCGESAVDLIAFELGHVDAIGRKSAHRLVEGGRNVAHLKHECRHGGALVRFKIQRLARHEDKACRVVGGVLNVARKNFQPIDFCGQLRRNCRNRGIAQLSHDPCSTRGIRGDHRLNAMLAQEAAALAKRHDVGMRLADRRNRRTRQGHELKPDRHEMLTDNLQACPRQKMVNVTHAACNRVFDRDHGEIGVAAFHAGEDFLERCAGHRLHAGANFIAGNMRVGAGLALIGDPPCRHIGHQAWSSILAWAARTASRSAGVSTPLGPSSGTTRQDRCIPFSSARNCSSFSRSSSGDGGVITNRPSAARL